MKKILYMAMLVALTSFASCDRYDDTEEMGRGGYDDHELTPGYLGVDTMSYVELAGINWATHNLGAERPEFYGNYYSWIYDATRIEEELAGTGWRLPTMKEFQTLIDSCEWTHIEMPMYTEDYWYIEGCEVKDSTNGNTIFLPEAGKAYPGRDVENGDGYYWTSNIQIMKYVWYLNFGDHWHKMSAGKDYYTEMSIRLVFDSKY